MLPLHQEWYPSQISADWGFSQKRPRFPSDLEQSRVPSVQQSEASPFSLRLLCEQSESALHTPRSSLYIFEWRHQSVQKCCFCPKPSQQVKTCDEVWQSAKKSVINVRIIDQDFGIKKENLWTLNIPNFISLNWSCLTVEIFNARNFPLNSIWSKNILSITIWKFKIFKSLRNRVLLTKNNPCRVSAVK